MGKRRGRQKSRQGKGAGGEEDVPLFDELITVKLRELVRLGQHCAEAKKSYEEGKTSEKEFERQLVAVRNLFKECLIAVKDENNADTVDHMIEYIVHQLEPGRLCAFVIGLCPTPKAKGHETLSGTGRQKSDNIDECCVTTRVVVRLFSGDTMPSPEQGGINSGGIVTTVIWINAREICTNDGVLCNECKSWSEEEGRSKARVLVITSLFQQAIGGASVALNISGFTENADKFVFKLLGEYGSFDGVSPVGTHANFLSHKCMCWDKMTQNVATHGTLSGMDKALKPAFEKIGFEPNMSLLQKAQEDTLCSFVVPGMVEGSEEDIAA